MSPSATCCEHRLVVAIPVTGSRICRDFSQCTSVVVFRVDAATKRVLHSSRIDPPTDQLGVSPRWLHDQGVDLVIAGGMEPAVEGILAELGVYVLVVGSEEHPDRLVRGFLDNSLQAAVEFGLQ